MGSSGKFRQELQRITHDPNKEARARQECSAGVALRGRVKFNEFGFPGANFESDLSGAPMEKVGA